MFLSIIEVGVALHAESLLHELFLDFKHTNLQHSYVNSLLIYCGQKTNLLGRPRHVLQLTLCVRFDSCCIFLAKLICSIYGHDRMTNSLPETISVTLISFESGTMESSCWPFSVSLPSDNIFSVCDTLNSVSIPR